VLDPASVLRALSGCDAVIHTAACYAFWLPDRSRIYRVNVDGTRHVLAAARELALDKVVYTSSVATLSPSFRPDGESAGDEEGLLDLRRFRGHYKMAKAMAEAVALREAARGLPLVIVHPSVVLGPGDRRPTPSGSMIVHFLNRRMKVFVDMVQNVIDVRDVAVGHVLALEHGRGGDRYVLGGDNLTLREMLGMLSEMTGLPRPWAAVPARWLAAAGLVNEWLSDHVTHRPPLVPREAALHARDSGPVDAARARRELGLAPRPAERVLADAVRWFAGAGFCPRATAARVLARLGAPESDERGSVALTKHRLPTA
jgi:dihydroflavonol-4-reductase